METKSNPCPNCGLSRHPRAKGLCIICLCLKNKFHIRRETIELRLLSRCRWNLLDYATTSNRILITNSVQTLRDSIIKHRVQTIQLLELARSAGFKPLSIERNTSKVDVNNTSDAANRAAYFNIVQCYRQEAQGLCSYCEQPTDPGELDTSIPAHINHSGSSGRRASYWRVMHTLNNCSFVCPTCNGLKGAMENRGLMRLRSIHSGLYHHLSPSDTAGASLTTPNPHEPFQISASPQTHGPRPSGTTLVAAATVAALALSIISTCIHDDEPLHLTYAPSSLLMKIGCATCVGDSTRTIQFLWKGKCRASVMRSRPNRDANKKPVTSPRLTNPDI